MYLYIYVYISIYMVAYRVLDCLWIQNIRSYNSAIHICLKGSFITIVLSFLYFRAFLSVCLVYALYL
jgi:hypothetical protein